MTGTLTGHATGHDSALVLDHAAVAKAIGTTSGPEHAPEAEVPEPLASVLAYRDEDPDEADSRGFVPTAELVTALSIDLATLSRQLSDLGCRSKRERIPTEDGTLRQVHGYLITDIRTAAEAIRDGNPPEAAVTTNDE